MLNWGRRLAKGQERITWMLGDGERIGLPDESMDWVVARESLCYVQPEKLQAMIEEIVRVMRPGGIMVVNLQYSHDHYAIHLDRIRRSFGDSVLVVDDKDGCNSIVFARKGVGFAQVRQSAMRLPESLDVAAAAALLPALTQVAAASRQQQGESSDGIGGPSAHARSPA